MGPFRATTPPRLTGDIRPTDLHFGDLSATSSAALIAVAPASADWACESSRARSVASESDSASIFGALFLIWPAVVLIPSIVLSSPSASATFSCAVWISPLSCLAAADRALSRSSCTTVRSRSG